MNRRLLTYFLYLFLSYFTLPLLGCSNTNSGQVVSSNTPIQYRDSFYDVSVIDSHVWVVGYDGKILFSPDKGSNWILQNSGTTQTLFCCQFLDTQTGWVAGDSGTILHTKDGGATWEKEDSGLKPYMGPQEIFVKHGDSSMVFKETGTLVFPLFDIFFVDKEHGWACGCYGTILRTTNGGVTWEDVSFKKTAEELKEEELLQEKKRKFGNEETKTDFWTIKTAKVLNKDVALNGIRFFDQKSGWVVGEFGTILYTEDEGDTWTRKEVEEVIDKTLYDVYFKDREEGLMVGIDGVIIHTTDGGKSWKLLDSKVNNSIFALAAGKDIFWAVGLRGVVVKSLDGGLIWGIDNSYCQISPRLNSLSGVATFGDCMIIVGDHGTILISDSLGQKWTRVQGVS